MTDKKFSLGSSFASSVSGCHIIILDKKLDGFRKCICIWGYAIKNYLIVKPSEAMVLSIKKDMDLKQWTDQLKVTAYKKVKFNLSYESD